MDAAAVTALTSKIDGNITTIAAVGVAVIGVFLAIKGFKWIKSAM